ncbi:Translation machinery-associated protein 16 [Frankliniella fusca]|uniref:Translation machinery-associated protein 16 n=1 Tax=Frankliniella fusca TaxID=407009 RepID=A0AAE1GZK4_9NEOP|nr:Translation machinery-associated protein 16 [Frankliniella fusca]
MGGYIEIVECKGAYGLTPKQQKKSVTLDNVSHPKSRKAIKMFKENKKHAAREKTKMATYVKLNLVGEKLLWFKERIPPDVAVCSKSCIDELLQTYLCRFDEELEQIRLKHSIGQRKNRQHASREDLIRHTQEREREEYNTCGIELPNLLDEGQVKILREWNGELRFLQNFKLVRLGKKNLHESNSMDDETTENSTKTSDETNDEDESMAE